MDYLVYEETGDGTFWSVCDVCGIVEDAAGGSDAIEYEEPEWNRKIEYRDFRDYQRRNKLAVNAINECFVANSVPKHFRRSIGAHLDVEEYDLLVITNPWQIDAQIEMPAKKKIGLVHDLIPNTFAVTKSRPDLNWGHLHHIGYKFYNTYCDYIYANSEATAKQYIMYYKSDKCRYFPACMPYSFKDARYTDEIKENAVLLAAPFDIRKGIKAMPGLINGAAGLIDTLYIFGMPRCTEEMFDTFFASLKVKKIVYYPYLENQELIALYKKCKLLLFPSTDEGLGIPLMEAQVCGCRVVTTNKRPMKDLAGEGSYLLTDSLDEDVANICMMLQDDSFDYAQMSKDARERFSHKNVLKVLDQIMDADGRTGESA